MSLNKKVGVLAGAASAAFVGLSFGGPAPGDDSASQWLTPERTEELRALIQDVMDDSQTRSSLLADGAGAGYMEGKGFGLWNEDGSFSMWIGGQVQFRYVWNNRDEDTSSDADVAGFTTRRTKLWFTGNLFSPDFTYKIQGAFKEDGGTFVLEDAWGNWNLGNGWDVGWGQFKDFFLKEELISSAYQQAVERSYVDDLTNTDRTQGIWAHGEWDQLDLWLSFNDGAVINSTGQGGGGVGLNTGTANVPWSADPNEFGFTARAEWLGAGSKEQFEDYTSPQGEEFGWLLGAAGRWQDSEYGTGAEEVEFFQWTVDAQVEFGGANVAGYVVGTHSSPNADASPEFDQLGFVIQGGFYLNEDWEAFGRYEWYDSDGAFALSDEIAFVTFGVNQYCHSHRMKWTTDVVWSLDPVSVGDAGAGILADGSVDSDDQFALRTQVQFLIK